MATRFNDKTVKHGEVWLPAPQRPRDPEEIARAIFRAVAARRSRLTLSRLPAIAGRLQALAPSLFLILMRLVGRLRRRR
jgi:hypothetical protein